MVSRHLYAALGTQHRTMYDVPSRPDLTSWERWAWRELGIAVLRTALPAAIVGVAVLLQTPQLKGIVLLDIARQFPLWYLCHEIGHLMTGQGYTLDLMQDGVAWRRVPAEVAATEYALCLLIDAPSLMVWLGDGHTTSSAAHYWQVPTAAIEWRLRLLGLRAP